MLQLLLRAGEPSGIGTGVVDEALGENVPFTGLIITEVFVDLELPNTGLAQDGQVCQPPMIGRMSPLADLSAQGADGSSGCAGKFNQYLIRVMTDSLTPE